MAYWVYILQSESTSKHYIGQTCDLPRRLKEHNDSTLGIGRYTRKQKGPWRLIHSEKFSSRGEAMMRERFLKSGRGREWVRDNVEHGPQGWQSPPSAD